MSIRRSDYENYDYREFWSGEKRLYEDCSERLALKKLITGTDGDDAVFADVGCGYGRLFRQYAGFSSILLIDYSMNNLRNARQRISKYLGPKQEKLESVHFIAADATRLPLKPDTVDMLLSVRLVHHLPRPELYFEQVARVLKPGGTYILEFANKRNTKNILRAMVGKMDTPPFSLTPSRIGETIQNYHPRYILNLLKENGLKPVKLLSVSNFRLQVLKKIFPLKVLMFMENFYQNTLSFISLGPSIFLKAKTGKPGKKDGPRRLEDMLCCPACGQEKISIGPDQVTCQNCQKIYKIEDGIYNFKNVE
ncbi:MAG: class I SAM-dependent methyltransferase [Actinomycetota bacterium]|nr:class I SAM-dependent methyltransferase [Actinomycetota bacterium]